MTAAGESVDLVLRFPGLLPGFELLPLRLVAQLFARLLGAALAVDALALQMRNIRTKRLLSWQVAASCTAS